MRNLVNASAVVAMALTLAACSKPAADVDANEAAANATMPADNAAMTDTANNSDAMANVDAAANTADTGNADDQGSTDHGSTDH
jgi:hypothetical protein